MIGTHAILQFKCRSCFGDFLVGNELTMRVVEIGANLVTGTPAGVMVEYLHDDCRKENR